MFLKKQQLINIFTAISFICFFLLYLLNRSQVEGLTSNKSNSCPEGCKRPTSIHGNCVHYCNKKTNRLQQISCPWVCPNPMSKCKYDQNCEKCQPHILFNTHSSDSNPKDLVPCDSIPINNQIPSIPPAPPLFPSSHMRPITPGVPDYDYANYYSHSHPHIHKKCS